MFWILLRIKKYLKSRTLEHNSAYTIALYKCVATCSLGKEGNIQKEKPDLIQYYHSGNKSGREMEIKRLLRIHQIDGKRDLVVPGEV
jgi:hypothetical protein